MRIIKKAGGIHHLPLLVLVLLALGCTSAKYVNIFPVAPGVFQYFLPPTRWEAKTLDVEVDITYRNVPGSPAACNISLVKSGSMPRTVSSAFFTASGAEYPLENITKLFAELKDNKLRITTQLPGEKFLKLLEEPALLLVVILDGTQYDCTPPEVFLEYCRQVRDDINS